MTTENRRPRHSAYVWLGTGAVTVGIGAATLVGPVAVASADTGDSGSHSRGAHSTNQRHATGRNRNDRRTVAEVSSATPTKVSRHQPQTAPAAPTGASDSTVPAPAPNAKIKRPKVIANMGADIDTPAPTEPIAIRPGTAVTAAAVVAAKSAATTITTTPTAAAAATKTPTNPITALINAIHKALLSFHAMFFNTPPRITQIVGPTRNPDGTYTGQIVAIDDDGDPLIYSASSDIIGSTTIDADGHYTYTPSAKALSTPGYAENLYFTVAEANASSHYHGTDQIMQAIISKVLHPTMLFYFPGLYGQTFTQTKIAVGPATNM